MVSWTKMPAAGRVRARPRAIAAPQFSPHRLAALLIAVLLAAALWIAAARAEAGDPPALDLFVNLAPNPLVDLGGGFAAPALAPAGGTLISGIPLNLALREEGADVPWRVVTGANGRYTMPLTDQLSVTGNGRFAKTGFADGAAPGSTATSANTDFTYAAGRWTFDLQPGMEIVHADIGTSQRDAIMEGRVGRALTDRVSLAGTGRYRWREMAGEGTVDSEIAYGRLGFIYAPTDRVRADMGYMMRQETNAAGAVTRNVGPSVILALPLDPSFDLAAKYEYTTTRRQDGADAAAATLTQDLHQLGLALTWDLGRGGADMHLSAAYKWERFDAAGTPEAARHLGRVNFAVNF